MKPSQTLQIRPYARLLTMLGEQLIRNERIALIELIKNSYDADANWVKISFNNFGDNYEIKADSQIIIEDDGHGMTREIIEKHWLNPATPEKKNRKDRGEGKTSKGRVLQGEKGIGRFAILKLGRKIDIITRPKGGQNEYTISYDFSAYDDDFAEKGVRQDQLFLDQLEVTLREGNPSVIKDQDVEFGVRKKRRGNQGTTIVISNLKGSWSGKKIKEIYDDSRKLTPCLPRMVEAIKHKEKSEDVTQLAKAPNNDFDICIYFNKISQNFEERYIEKLANLLVKYPVFRIEEGRFDAKKKVFSYSINDSKEKETLSLDDSSVAGLRIFKDRFGAGDASVLRSRQIECGSFGFTFYIFDFGSKAPPKYQLDKDDKKIIKDNRIYLYRDGIRVYPYGEKDDDWLGIDMDRGTISAGEFFSNDQIVGFVNITQEENPELRDKTNREGLIDVGNATDDFITLLRTFLKYIREKPYRRYQEDLKEKDNKEEIDTFQTCQVKKDLDDLKILVKDIPKASRALSKVQKAYDVERQYLVRRAEITEELAGVGLSVETASHDIMGMMGKVFANLDGLIRDLMSNDEIENTRVLNELQTIRGGMSFIEAQLKDIQLLFKSSKQSRRLILLSEIIEKVQRLYQRLLKKENISLSTNIVGGPLKAKTTDAVLLQLLLNLFDNSIYWLQQSSRKDKQILITLDGGNGQMIFSDNGPGIDEKDKPYIFKPFYSGKGQDGRGLGLYIARQLLERSDYSIELADIRAEKKLSGANFVINFVAKGD